MSAAWALVLAASAHPAPHLIGMTTLPRVGPDGLAVGGLSGIDFDRRHDEWILISDDRSDHGPARMWRASIDYAGEPIARLIAPIILRSASGQPFPPQGTGAEAVDSEAVRLDPRSRSLIWSSEGDTRDRFGPGVRISDRAGRLVRLVPLPAMLAYDPAGQSGPRINLSFEGLSVSPDGRSLWIGEEAPLFQDGPLASPTKGADVRLSRIALRDGRLEQQYAYRVEPIGPVPPGRLADNGVSEILAIDARHFLVVERSGIEQPDHDFRYHARLWCAGTDGADDVGRLETLRGQSYRVMPKRLVFDFTQTPRRIDSVEGMSWGRTLANGNASLVFVTDNDFSPQRENQIIVLDVGAPREAVSLALCSR